MSPAQFKKYNNLTGWLIFAISTLVYTLTMESSASFWDCGEFIAASYKLQVVHPPGAPIFLIIGRLFSLLSFGNVEMIALMMNLMSAICSAFAMLFLFWSITLLAKNFYTKNKQNLDKNTAIVILGSGFVGALAGTFCDSIWFSAVEAEVYSMSFCFTALVVWLMLKWNERADEPYADRLLVLILFLMGVSIGVHWLNLLTIPALSYLYFFKRYSFTWKGFILTGVISLFILGFFMKGIITGLAGMATGIEIAFVNNLGLPFNSGVFFFIFLLMFSFTGSLYFLKRKKWMIAYNVVTALVMVTIGFSPIATTVIRASADTPINMNNPQDMPALMSFLNREQYENRPLLTGANYNAGKITYEKYADAYQKGKDKYDVVGDKVQRKYTDNQTIYFPRMHSTSNTHQQLYEHWTGLRKGENPTYTDNIEFFVKYQLGWMYWRYFNWNFVGRQNDVQGVFGPKAGNWLSGISVIDNARLGTQQNLPDYKKNQPSRNTFYCIPLILGLIGFLFHIKKDRKRAFAMLVLFISTGILLIIYGNSPPIEPRERDYIFAASFWVFCIWIGLSAMAFYQTLKRKISFRPAALVAIGLSLSAPILMGWQGWDDHNRSESTFARDIAKNYLESCEANAILFTQGDNDTYPLWYLQEVEGIRTDVRIVNLSLLGADWYINKMRKQLNEAEPVAFSVQPDKYRGDKRNQVIFYENKQLAPPGKHVNLSSILAFIHSDKKKNQLPLENNYWLNYYPSKSISIPVNKEDIVKNKVVAQKDLNKVEPAMKWKLNKNQLFKHDIYMLDIIAENAKNGWQRPIYFSATINPDSYLGLQKYFQLEGLAYRLVPIEAENEANLIGRIRTDTMYHNVMNDFAFGNIEKQAFTTNENSRKLASAMRSKFSMLAAQLIEEGEQEKAIEILDTSYRHFKNEKIPFDYSSLFDVQSYFAVNRADTALHISDTIAHNFLQDIAYVKSLSKNFSKAYQQDLNMANMGINQLIRIAAANDQTAWAKSIKEKYDALSI